MTEKENCNKCLTEDSIRFFPLPDCKRVIIYCSECSKHHQTMKVGGCNFCPDNENSFVKVSRNFQYAYPYCKLHPEDNQEEKFKCIKENRIYDDKKAS